MKRKFLVVIAAALAVPLLLATSVQAFSGHAGDRVELPKDKVLDSAFFGAGKNIVIAGTVKGDVYCGGQTVEITGTVEGDVLCGAQDIVVSGTVKGDVRVAAQNIRLTGMVGGNVSLLGQVITLESSGRVSQDVSAAGQNIRLQGKVGRDVVATGDSVTLEGQVGRETRLFSSEATLKADARLGGDFIYTSKNEVIVENGAQITGATDHQMPSSEPKPQPSLLHRIVWPVYGLATMLVAGIVLLLLAPRWFHRATVTMQAKPLPVLGLGLAGLLVPPFVVVGLVFTFVGIPLSVLGFVLWVVICASSLLFSSYSIGQLIVQRLNFLEKWADFAALVVGLLIFGVIWQIPVLNLLAVLGGTLWGIGGIFWALGSSIVDQRRAVSKTKKS